MPAVDLIDETFVVCAPEVLAGVVRDPRRWRAWWPDLDLAVFMDRGSRGIRWSVSGPFTGSNEIWLEPVGDGTLVHYFLRVDPVGAAWSPRRAASVRRDRALSWKRWVNALKDELERGRPPGLPAPAPPDAVEPPADGSGATDRSSPTGSVPTKPE